MRYSLNRWSKAREKWLFVDGSADPNEMMTKYSYFVNHYDPDPDANEYRVVNEHLTVVATNTSRAFEGKEMRDQTGGAVRSAMTEVSAMRGRAVYVARAKLGGLWFNVGTFEVKGQAWESLNRHWNTPDVQARKVDTMVVR